MTPPRRLLPAPSPALIAALLPVLTACHAAATLPGELQLTDAWAGRAHEYSSAAWVDDELWLMPQYPRRDSAGTMQVPVFPRDRVEAACGSRAELAPDLARIRGAAHLFDEPGFEGFEGLTATPGHIYLLIEYGGARMNGVLVRAAVTGEREWTFDPDWRINLDPPVQLFNMAFEGITTREDGSLLILFERNGETLFREPYALIVDVATRELTPVPIAAIPHRVTDLSGMEDGSFWALNYRWEGDSLEVEGRAPIERVVELHLDESGITPTGHVVDIPPGRTGRNWEGLVRVGACDALLIVTDRSPRTIVLLVRVED